MAKRTAIALAIAGVISVGGFEEPAQAEDRCGHTHKQRKRIHRAARRTLEANRAQARRVMRSCRKRRNVPVNARHLARRSSTFTSTRYGQASKCRTVTDGVAYESAVFLNFGTVRLATYRMTKTWCWRNGRVTRHPYPEVVADITGTAWAWDYHGQVAGGQHYEPYRGRFKGSHTSWSQGHFSVCVLKIGCFHNPVPLVRMRGFAGGSVRVEVHK